MNQNTKKLTNTTEVIVRFSETDPLGVVWHGHYVRYFEDGREAFGKQFGLSYLHYYKNEVFAPVVKLNCNYKQPLRYGDIAVIETTYQYTESAKIIFNYTIKRKESGLVVATGSSTQVFIEKNGQLIYSTPDFYLQWQKSMDLTGETC